MLWFKAAASFVHSRDNTAAQPSVIYLWRWGNLVMQHSSFLGGSWAFRMHISRPYPNQGIRCFYFSVSLSKLLCQIPWRQEFQTVQGTGRTLVNSMMSTRSNTTQWQGWLASVCSATTSAGTFHPFSCSCRKPGAYSQSIFGAAEGKPFCIHQYHLL